MTPKETVRGMFAALSAGDAAGFLAPMADDVVFTLIGTTAFSGTRHGKQAIIEGVLAPLGAKLDGGIRMTVDRLIAEGDTVVSLSRGEAKTRDGRDYNNTYAHVWRFRDGRIVEVREYLDTELVTAALGGNSGPT